MLPLTIAEVIRATQGLLVVGDPAIALGIKPWSTSQAVEPPWPPHGVSIDSRTLRKGDLFFAILGDRFDGHKFVNECIRKGAGLCVVSQMPQSLNINLSRITGILKVKDARKALADTARFYRLKYGSKIQMAAVAGSCGKTSVKEMTAQIMRLAGPSMWSSGNHNNDVGSPLALLNLEPEHVYGVFEIGSSARGDVKRLAEIVLPQAAVITNIRLEHTATFGTLEDIAEGESEVLSVLPEGGCAVLPFEDPFFNLMKSRVPKNVQIKSFGFSNGASVYVSRYSTWPETQFTIVHQDSNGHVLERLDCTLPVLGKFNILNACAAAALCFAMKVPSEMIRKGLAGYVPPQLRFQVRKLDNGAVIVNDSYNANPGSMRSALESFVESFPDKKRCVVLGDMLELGEISRKEHQALGAYVAGLPLSKVLWYGPQSRSAYEGAKHSLMNEKTVSHFTDMGELEAACMEILGPDHAVLFKGSRGMKLDEAVSRLCGDVVSVQSGRVA